MDADHRTVQFAWQGIEIAVPPAWDLSAYHGDVRAGYARLDDGMHMRLHVRWSQGAPKGTDLRATVERYRRGLLKANKNRLTFDETAVSFLPKAMRNDRDALAFQWHREDRGQAGYGLACHCRSCHRVVLAEILFPQGEADTKLAQGILRSLRDHRDDGQRLWSVYGFSFCTPTSFDLAHAGLEPGRLRFLLRASRRSWLRVERWSLASQWMQQAPLEQWPEEMLKLMRVTKRAALQPEQTEINGHPAQQFATTVARGVWLGRERIEGLIWLCPEDDKMYAVMSGGGEDALVQRIAATITCA